MLCRLDRALITPVRSSSSLASFASADVAFSRERPALPFGSPTDQGQGLVPFAANVGPEFTSVGLHAARAESQPKRVMVLRSAFGDSVSGGGGSGGSGGSADAAAGQLQQVLWKLDSRMDDVCRRRLLKRYVNGSQHRCSSMWAKFESLAGPASAVEDGACHPPTATAPAGVVSAFICALQPHCVSAVLSAHVPECRR